MSLSVVVNTKNSAETLEATLKSVYWADEIVVVDMFSQDKTVEIAKKFTKNIFTHPDVGYVEPARNFAIAKAGHDWILVLDADEEVSPDLKELILKLISTESEASAYYFPRKNLIFGRWIKHAHWWPDYQLRLFQKGSVTWSDEIHSIPITTGEVAELPAQENLSLIHHNYQTIHQFIERLNRYTEITAKNKTSISPPSSANLINSSGLVSLKTFFNEFLSRFFADEGYRDHEHGLSLSLLQAFYELVVKLKAWEKTGFEHHETSFNLWLKDLRNFQTDLNFWIADYRVKYAGNFLTKAFWRLRRKLRV